MSVLVRDPLLIKQLKAERLTAGADRYDEVWDGVYIMSPMPDDEHQQLVMELAAILHSIVSGSALGHVRPGVNVSDRKEDWTYNYRIPDVAVFLNGGKAKNCGTHWVGGPDLVVEITSPDDQARDKLSFYTGIGVRELLLVDRDPWALELYQLRKKRLRPAGASSLDQPAVLASTVLPLTFQLTSGTTRPMIEVARTDGKERWSV